MSLPTGSYTIRCAGFSSPYVARNPVEDRSLHPKEVVVLPNIIPSSDFRKWEITNLDNGRYTLTMRGGPTAAINNLVYAILLDTPPPEEWILEELPQYGKPSQYLIQANNRLTGWVIPDESPLTQVESRPLIMNPSEPPQFPANQRWIIEEFEELH